MAALVDLVTDPLFQAELCSADAYLGTDRELWLARLPFGAKTPDLITLTVDTAVAVDDETVQLTAASDVTLDARQVLYFQTDDTLLVVDTETVLPATVSTAVPILPAEAVVTLAETADVYPVRIILSIENGGQIQTQFNLATANNKGGSIFDIRAVTTGSKDSSFTGTILRDDAGTQILDTFMNTGQAMYLESRRPPYDGRGRGSDTFATFAGRVFVSSFSVNSDRADFEKVDGAFAIDGKGSRYSPPGLALL